MIYPKPDIKTGHNSAIYCLDFDPESELICTGDGGGQLVAWKPGIPDGTLVAQGSSPWYTLSFLPAQNSVVAGNLKGEMWWIDPRKKQVLQISEAHQKGVFSLLPYGKDQLLSGGGDGVLHQWEGFEKQQSLKISHNSLRGLSESKAHQLIAVAASDGNIYLIDYQTFAVLKIIVEAHRPSVFTVCFSACGRYLFSGGRDAMLAIWDISSGFELLQRIPAHHYTINHICLSPDRKLLYTASRDRTIKVWDAHTFQLQKVLDTAKYGVHTASVNRLVTTQADQLFSVSDDKRLVLWPA
jgi:WD40 repeat protein